MKNYFSNIAYLKRKERKSTLFLIFILLVTSFIDDVFRFSYLSIKSETKIEHPVDSLTLQDFNLKSEVEDERYQEAMIQPPGGESSLEINRGNISSIRTDETALKKYSPSEKMASQPKIINEKDKKTPQFTRNRLPGKFNPNKVVKDSLRAWGVSEFAASNWIKYIDSGGKIYKPEQLSKVYGLDTIILQRLLPLVSIPEMKEQEPRFEKKQIIPFDINKATSEELQTISGIGQVLSSRILKYRDKLGGFYDIYQVKEVYGIQDSVIDQNLSILQINTGVKKININNCEETELSSHPYVSPKQSKVIINYRKQHGFFRSLADLSGIAIIDDQWLTRISPYLEF